MSDGREERKEQEERRKWEEERKDSDRRQDDRDRDWERDGERERLDSLAAVRQCGLSQTGERAIAMIPGRKLCNDWYAGH